MKATEYRNELLTFLSSHLNIEGSFFKTHTLLIIWSVLLCYWTKIFPFFFEVQLPIGVRDWFVLSDLIVLLTCWYNFGALKCGAEIYSCDMATASFYGWLRSIRCLFIHSLNWFFSRSNRDSASKNWHLKNPYSKPISLECHFLSSFHSQILRGREFLTVFCLLFRAHVIFLILIRK